MAKSAALNAENAWNAVALEERLELVMSAKAKGVVFAVVCAAFIGSVAYGFDNFPLFVIGSGVAALLIPIKSQGAWRKAKPELILTYLAVRSIARRYAFGYHLRPLDIVLIFRGRFESYFRNAEEEALLRSNQRVDFESTRAVKKDVWICLLRGGLLLLSERTGGARLEFIAPVSTELTCRRPRPEEKHLPEQSLIITGAGNSRGQSIVITSRYPGALYVFEKRLEQLLSKLAQSRQRQQKGREQALSA